MNKILSAGAVILLFFIIVLSSQAISQNDSVKTDIIKESANAFRLSLSSRRLKQGEILVARIENKNSLPANLTAVIGNIKGKFFKNQESNTESLNIGEAIMGIPADMKPGEYVFIVRSDTGEEIAKESITVIDGKFRRQNISVSKSTKALTPIPGELEAIQSLKESLSSTRYWSKTFISPTPDCENSPFGVKRYHNGVYINDYHKGMDLRSPYGRPIRAITGGIVKIATSRFRLHGGTVGLDHGHGLTSIYIHMSKVVVKEGDRVKKGDIIGYVGATGFATGPHLHWGLYANGVPVNADFWIPVPHC